MTAQPPSSEFLDPQETQTGSPAGEPVFLAVGRLGKPHGVRGEIQMVVLTDFPERLKRGLMLYVGENYRPLRLARVRTHQEFLLLTFNTMTNREEVGELRNQYVFVRAAQVPDLPDGDYYHHQLIGMNVVDDPDTPLGEVVDILETGANDVLIVRRPDGSEILLPFVETFVAEVSLAEGKIRMKLPEGLY